MSWASDRISRAADKSRFMQFVQTVSSRALGLAVATALMLLVFVAANTFVGKRLERSILLVDTIDDFEAALGFGGMIHAFKNAVLRPDETDYLERARIEAARAAELVDALTIQVARLPEPVALTETRAMVALYASNLDRVEEMNAAGIDTRAIDRAVRVDDTPALREREALRRIAEANLAFWRRALDLLLFAEIATFSVVAGGAVIAVARQRHIAAAQNATRWALERETEVNADLQAFAYAASHDLKSPLSTAVMLLDEVVRSDAEDALSEDQSQLLGHAARTLKRAQRQVADIMTLASVLRGDPSVAATVDPTDLNAVFENVRDDLHGELAAAGAVLEVGPLPHLRGYSWRRSGRCVRTLSRMPSSTARRMSRPSSMSGANVTRRRVSFGSASLTTGLGSPPNIRPAFSRRSNAFTGMTRSKVRALGCRYAAALCGTSMGRCRLPPHWGREARSR